MTRDYYKDVVEFHQKFGVPIMREPMLVDVGFRMRLIEEEYKELTRAVDNTLYKADLVATADALADLVYVTLGAALAWGINFPAVWDEVHRSNMRKVGGARRPDGKILKPEGWNPPNVVAALKEPLDAY